MRMDDHALYADAVAVKDGFIVYVGDNKNALRWQDGTTEVIDLEGKTMLPGFIESHIHPTMYGINLLELDCRPASTPTIEGILEKVKSETESAPEGQWIRGWGWDDSKLKGKRNPTLRKGELQLTTCRPRQMI